MAGTSVCCYFYEHSDILKILFRYRTDDDFVLFLNERFNGQYPNLINKGYFTDVDDNTMRLGTFIMQVVFIIS